MTKYVGTRDSITKGLSQLKRSNIIDLFIHFLKEGGFPDHDKLRSRKLPKQYKFVEYATKQDVIIKMSGIYKGSRLHQCYLKQEFSKFTSRMFGSWHMLLVYSDYIMSLGETKRREEEKIARRKQQNLVRSRKFFIDGVKQLREEFGRPPSNDEFRERFGQHHTHMYKHFNSWSDLLKACRLKPPEKGKSYDSLKKRK